MTMSIRKHMAIVFAIVAMFGIGFVLAGTGQASATGGGHPDPDNKKVTLCHATGSQTNPYTKITVSVQAFYQAGHIDHQNDIWQAFSYTTKGGEVVTVPQRGNVNLLAFEDCQEPRVDEKIVKPAKTIVDKCGIADDSMSVPPGRGYTVGPVTGTHPNFSGTVTTDEGFQFTDETRSVTYTTSAADFPNNDDCDLPETGSDAVYNTPAGIASLAGILLLGGLTIVSTRRRKA